MDMRPTFILPPRLDPLKNYQKWNVWKWERDEQGEWKKKPPFMPRFPYHKDPLTWGSFDEAMQALSLGSFNGLGFDFRNTPILGFDLDDCRNPETGAILPLALKTVHKLQTYTEISASGTGLKLFGKLFGIGPGAKLHKKLKVPNSPMSMEFWRDCERYSTITGVVLPGTEQYPLADISAWMDWFVSYLERANELVKQAPLWVNEALTVSKIGERSEEVFRVATYLHEQGWSADDIEMLLTGSPLAARFKSVELLRKDIARAAAKSNPQGVKLEEGELMGRSLEGVKKKGIKWIWKGWIPKGYITLFVGETGSGKTTVIAYIVARITDGGPWPTETLGRPAARVLWLGSEDGIEEMTVPRLEACGANLANVIEIQGVKVNGQRNTFSMQDDIAKVEKWLEYATNEGKPFDVLVVDPITSYLGSRNVLKKVDLSKTGQLRPILEQWFVLAQKYKLAIIGVTHFTKDTSRSMLHRVIESGAFAQTCRSLVAVIDMTDDSDPYAKAMMQVKINLPEHPGGAWRFNTEKVELGLDDDGEPVVATRPVWKELDETLNPKNAIGGSRGPKSQFTPLFGFWAKTYFEVKKAEWLLVDDVRAAALRENIANDRWWRDHSSEYLEKKNENGAWVCRVRRGAEWKGGD